MKETLTNRMISTCSLKTLSIANIEIKNFFCEIKHKEAESYTVPLL